MPLWRDQSCQDSKKSVPQSVCLYAAACFSSVECRQLSTPMQSSKGSCSSDTNPLTLSWWTQVNLTLAALLLGCQLLRVWTWQFYHNHHLDIKGDLDFGWPQIIYSSYSLKTLQGDKPSSKQKDNFYLVLMAPSRWSHHTPYHENQHGF